MLPVEPDDEIVTLGEGCTPLLTSRLGQRVFIKDESKNPTRSFKSRGMACAVTMAKNLGARSLAAPTAGNAGAALSAYGARAGMPVFVAMPVDTPKSIVDRLYAGIAAVMKNPEFQAELRARDVEPLLIGPAEFSKYIRRESQKWGQVIQANKITAE